MLKKTQSGNSGTRGAVLIYTTTPKEKNSVSAVGARKTQGAHMEKQHECQILLCSAYKEHATIDRHILVRQ